MRTRRIGPWLATAGALSVMVAPAAARADAPFPIDEGVVVGLGAAALLLPSDVGVAIPTANASAPNFVLGWSVQVPFSEGFRDPNMHHRAVVALDLLPRSDGADWRVRLGYRYGRRHAFAGLGVGIDGAGGHLSPELGVKFGHAEDHDRDIDLSFHLLARAEIAPDSGHLLGTTILLGWNCF
jgi:hypothetical protein